MAQDRTITFHVPEHPGLSSSGEDDDLTPTSTVACVWLSGACRAVDRLCTDATDVLKVCSGSRLASQVNCGPQHPETTRSRLR